VASEKIILVPKNLLLAQSLEFIAYLNSLEPADSYHFDFTRSNLIDPFSLIYLSREIQAFRSKRGESDFIAKNFGHLTYHSHMGFFKAFGLDFGKNPGAASGSLAYIPITIYNCEDIRREASAKGVNPGEILTTQSEQLALILTQGKQSDYVQALSFSMREIFRNAVEHSESQQIGFCAQYLPSQSLVKFAILDTGIGIAKSLSRNKDLQIKNDLDGLYTSLKPGISGKVPSIEYRHDDHWQNSGFGLFMTSELAKRKGSFSIASGDHSLTLVRDKKIELPGSIQGTIVGIDLNVQTLKDFEEIKRTIYSQIPKDSSGPSGASGEIFD